MTRPEKLTYVQGLEARIVELEDQVQRQAARILVLAGVDATKPGFSATLHTFDSRLAANANAIRESRLAN